MDAVLSGLKVVITRPRGQSEALSKKLEKLGAETVIFPALEITAVTEPEKLNHISKQFKQANILIFISRNAVGHSAEALKKTFSKQPDELIVAAIGHGTAEKLAEIGWKATIIPDKDKSNSENLLTLPELNAANVKDKHIVIIRGDNGRELLANTLRERAAHVSYAEVYQRLKPQADIIPVLKQQPDVIITTSNEGLQNLYDMTPANLHETLLGCQLLVISENMVGFAETLGFSAAPIVSNGASDEAIIQALC